MAVLVAGAGPLEHEMTAAARKAGVSLHMLGFCNQTEMPAAYAAADILVLPSESETWGLVANEALACGRPVVLSDAVGAAPDLAADKTAGRVFPVGDVAALAAILNDIVRSPPTPAMIAAKSEIYSLGAAADGIEAALYDDGADTRERGYAQLLFFVVISSSLQLNEVRATNSSSDVPSPLGESCMSDASLVARQCTPIAAG